MHFSICSYFNLLFLHPYATLPAVTTIWKRHHIANLLILWMQWADALQASGVIFIVGRYIKTKKNIMNIRLVGSINNNTTYLHG